MMLRHLMKLIWKRKARNLMLSLEILLAFAVVFAIAAFGARSYQLYQLPIGFQYQQLWSVFMLADGDRQIGIEPEMYELFRRGLLELPEVEQVAFTSYSPFGNSTMRTGVQVPASGRKVQVDMVEASDEYFALAGMRLQQGRWFSRSDEGAAATPVVLNRRMADTLFPGQDPLGKQFSDSPRDQSERTSYQVLGVLEEYRGKGELMTPVNMMLLRFSPLSSKHGVRTIMLKVRPGTERAFEATLNRKLKAIRNDWGYEIAPLPAMRAEALRSHTTPLIILAVIAAFLLVMVGFGLFGVLWQNTTRRIPEIGLRRAIGASSADIYRQIIGEQLLLSSAAMLVALALLVQLPITGALGEGLNWPVFATAAVLSMGVIYLISLLCSLYPGWRASRLSPTEALHYE